MRKCRFLMTAMCLIALPAAMQGANACRATANEQNSKVCAVETIMGDTISENPIGVISQNPGYCSIFHSWGFIGDSLCSGEHEYHKPDGSKGYADLYEYSWGQRICAAIGAKGDNYSQGGETARGWITRFWDNPRNGNHNIDAKAAPKQVYVIALGVNDTYRKHPVGNIEADINKDDYTKNAQAYAGCYAGIIQRLQSIQPDAKIFVVTRPREKNTDERYNQVVRRMADIFENVYVIDLYKYAPSYEKGSEFRDQYFMGGHLNAAGYQYTAWMIMTYIDWIIRHNMKDFEQVAFIGTEYKF